MGMPPLATVVPLVTPSSTEQGVAREFARIHEAKLRFDHTRGRWLVWEGHSWLGDEDRRAFFWTLEHCYRLGLKKAERGGFASAVETIARALPPLSTSTGKWNPHSNLVACPDGVIELETGTLRPGRAEDMIDRRLGVSPAGTVFSQPWYDFLMTMFAGNTDLIDFLQRWCGYCLSGDISEHRFIFLHGTGANGKGTLLNTVARIWGDYCATASIDLFLESQYDRHPTELARLNGVHLVQVHETREGKRWDEAKIKAMTGGDRITARFMRRDEFEFFPRFKPMFAGNHRPQLRTVDEAIKRRMLLLPCTVTIPADQRDPKLGEKLLADAPVILAWAVEGFQHWRQIGLRPPATITEATDDYMANQDDLQQWLDDRTKRNAAGTTLSADLFRDWSGWKDQRKESSGAQRSFNDRLADRGFAKKKTMNGVAFENIELIYQPVGP